MRLWHQKLIPYLDRQRLLGQHRECCALRGKGWSKKHTTVDYVFKYDPSLLVAYHYLVMDEMIRRGYNPDKIWKNPCYRGKELAMEWDFADPDFVDDLYCFAKHKNGIIYPEHDNLYLKECMHLLIEKGAPIDWEKVKKDGLVKIFSPTNN